MVLAHDETVDKALSVFHRCWVALSTKEPSEIGLEVIETCCISLSTRAVHYLSNIFFLPILVVALDVISAFRVPLLLSTLTGSTRLPGFASQYKWLAIFHIDGTATGDSRVACQTNEEIGDLTPADPIFTWECE